MDKKYAIFDMDGTLVDSMPYWKNLSPEYLSSKGISDIPKDILEKITPMTVKESSRFLSACVVTVFCTAPAPDSTTAHHRC